ncbi:MAG: hypothetical protein RL329_3094 [Bacteroidota bacterium]|jgi:hypothetical protein
MKIDIKKISILGITCLGLWTSSCNDYLEINVDPTRINESQVTLASLLPTVIEGTSQAQFNYVRNSSGMLVQHITSVTGVGEDQHIEVRFGSAWTSLYLTAMTNLTLLIEKANTQSSPHYAAAGKILLAYNLNMATTAWENVPYSQAFSIQNLKPDYDTQESIFTKINQLLDEAILDLDKTSVKKMGADDMVYAGSLVRWKAAAKAMKARIAMQASAKGGVTAANNALAALSAGAMTSNADDFQLIYNLRNLNPWHSGVALANGTGNLTVRHSQQLTDALNGTTYGVFDPRMPILGGRTTANAAATTWIGVENGSGNAGNVDFSINSWHSRNLAPIQFVTFSEQKFIQAEAEFLKNGGTTTSLGTTAAGYQAYLDGITTNMLKVGVADTARTRYMADPKVAVGAANLSLQLIMAEKSKALFLNSETWNDCRRWDYSKDVFKDLDLPKNQSTSLSGKWIERALYPLDEFSRNAEVALKHQKAANVKMWIFSR